MIVAAEPVRINPGSQPVASKIVSATALSNAEAGSSTPTASTAPGAA